jgi:hypothetical protein
VGLIHTKDDGFGEAVRLLEEIRQVPGDRLGSGLEVLPPVQKRG